MEGSTVVLEPMEMIRPLSAPCWPAFCRMKTCPKKSPAKRRSNCSSVASEIAPVDDFQPGVGYDDVDLAGFRIETRSAGDGLADSAAGAGAGDEGCR